jgi:hypothetical protein
MARELCTFGWNWNCTKEPGGATTFSGKYRRLVPVESETCTTCTRTVPGLVAEGQEEPVPLAAAFAAVLDAIGTLDDQLLSPP